MLPGAPFLERSEGRLCLQGHDLDALARRFGTPLYVYSRASMLAAAAAYERALAGRPHLLCYAMKANSSLAVLQTFAHAGLGFDIVSGGELARVLAAGGAQHNWPACVQQRAHLESPRRTHARTPRAYTKP